jgi:hypothetical protein
MWEVKIGNIMVQGQPGKKLARSILMNKPGMGFHSCNPSYAEVISRRVIFEASLGKIVRPYLKK